MSDWRKRISVNPDQAGGYACIRNTQIRVVDVLNRLASSLSVEHVLEELPGLEEEDIEAALKYAERNPGRSAHSA